jgi:ABC-2 type transport system permease protein/lipopolysaccharide transport system permease protein
MTDWAAAAPEAPPPAIVRRRRVRWRRSIHEIVASRELLRALTEREFRSRYKQTVLGMSWAVVTPVLLMLVFVVFVNRAVRIDTGGAPYALFAYLGLLPWSFFSTSVSRGGTILVLESSLLNKVRCPREVFPLSTIGVALLDFAIGLCVLALLFLITWYAPAAQSLWFPVILVVQVVATVGIVLIVSIVVVYVRDLGQALPLLLQLGLFATPVAYGVDALPEGVRSWYALVNPMVGVISSYRDTMLLGQAPPWELLGPSAVGALVYLIGGYALFKRLEGGIADVA